jgi:predicted amidophosphoribosyltransferase
MDTLTSILGPLVLIGPLAAVVVWLMMATRRPSCPHCHYGVSRDATRCPHCGAKLELAKRSQRRPQRQGA